MSERYSKILFFLVLSSQFSSNVRADLKAAEEEGFVSVQGVGEARRYTLPIELRRAGRYRIEIPIKADIPPLGQTSVTLGSTMVNGSVPGAASAPGSSSGTEPSLNESGDRSGALAAPPPTSPPPQQATPHNSAKTTVPEGKKKSLSSLLVEANRLFNRKKFYQALSVLDQAEEIAPQSARVQTMKGSLFYRLGELELASDHWSRSLEINPRQPEIKALIDKLPRSQFSQDSVAPVNAPTLEQKKIEVKP